MSGFVNSIRRAFASKLRGSGFKSGQVQCMAFDHYNTLGCSAMLKTVTKGKHTVTKGKLWSLPLFLFNLFKKLFYVCIFKAA